MNSQSDDYYNKKIDNGLKKKELEEKYGANFSDGSKLDPELESEWLKNIEEFENQFHSAKRTTLWDFIGKPEFKKIDALKVNEITTELARLYDILKNNNIALDTLCDVADSELYRFITEELFIHEIDDMRVHGMTSHFTYEEFHPNAELDIEQAIDYFFSMSMGKAENIGGEGYDLLYIDTDNYKNAEGEPIPKQQVVKNINTFLDAFDTFEIITNETKTINLNNEKTDAKVDFHIFFKGIFTNSSDILDYEGDGCFKLKPSEYGGWSIYHINLPGLKI
jgi:hypothetical protein